HVAFAGSRHEEVAMKVAGLTYREIAARGGGILKTVADTRAAPKAELLAATRMRLDGMLRFGTTTAEVKSGYGLTVESELAILQAIQELSRSHPMGIVPTFLGAHAIPTEFSGRTDAYVDLVVDVMIRAVADHSSARFCDVWVEDGYFSAAQARRILATAKAHGLASKVHADELSDSGGAALAADIGAVSADHLVHASDAGLRAMADRGVVGVLLPGASLASGIPYADARQILDLGVPVALGTDCSPASLNESMPFVLALATHRLGMYPEEAISAATVNAAFAIGLGEQVGSLEPGKSGDLLVLDFNTYGHLGYRISGNPVETVVKAGLVVAKRPGVG
ncbi:MAG TPA: imidazolonepropionase, partial [Thermoplasmata archaeon]|nr:imidazolonepropionase [Thermoplasmata archaeon]